MKTLLAVLFFLAINNVFGQDSWLSHYGQSRNDIFNAFKEVKEYKSVPSGNYSLLMYSVNTGTVDETILMFWFNESELCTAVGVGLGLSKLDYLIKLLKSQYPHHNIEETKFWSERETAEVNLQSDQFFIVYTPNN